MGADTASTARWEREGPLSRVLVVVPTFNEALNLEAVVSRIRTADPTVEVLVVDDNSPDGTGLLADGLASADPRIHVLHRAGKGGLGAAYTSGFRWGLSHGYDVLVEMDADGSHQPEELFQLLQALQTADLVLGSRWVKGGKVVNWPVTRKVISRGGTTYAKLALKLPVQDATGGYRAFRSSALRLLDLDGVSSQGYCFQIELLLRTLQRGLVVSEVPITFIERELGQSKMSRQIIREAFGNVTRWGVELRRHQVRTALGQGEWPETRGRASKRLNRGAVGRKR